DMRALLADPARAAREAADLFVQRCVREIGAMIAVLGGVDALVFSGGIGARAPAVRAAICARLECFGVALDAGRNTADEPRISTDAARVPAFAWRTDEERVIARHCAALLAQR